MKKHIMFSLLIYLGLPTLLIFVQFFLNTLYNYFEYFLQYTFIPFIVLIGVQYTMASGNSLLSNWAYTQVGIIVMAVARWFFLLNFERTYLFSFSKITHWIIFLIYVTFANAVINLGALILKKCKERSMQRKNICGTVYAIISMIYFCLIPLTLYILHIFKINNNEFPSFYALYISPISMLLVVAYYGRFAKKNGIGWRGFGIWSASLIVFAFAFYFFCFGNYSSPEYWSSHLLLTTIVFAVLFIFSLVPYLIPVKSKLKE